MTSYNKVLICLIVIVIFSSAGCSKKPEVHSFDFPPTIFWNDTLYYVEDISHSSAGIHEINKKIGKILNVIDGSEKPKTNGTSNVFEKGCNIYTFKAKSEEEMIIIEYEGLYYIASPRSN